MKIKVTIERECCANEDLRPYNGQQGFLEKLSNLRFCIHCGQIWADVERNDETSRCLTYPTFGRL